MYDKTNAYIRRHRILRDISQKELAEYLGYSSPQFVSNCERGIGFYPSEKLKRVIVRLKLHKQAVIKTMIQDFKEKVHMELTQ